MCVNVGDLRSAAIQYASAVIHVAVSIAELARLDYEVFDAGAVVIEGAQSWLRRVQARLLAPGVVVVRDADLLDERTLLAPTTMLRPSQGSRLITTLGNNEPQSGAQARLHSLAPLSIHVPPLRSRPEDLEPIANAHLAALGRGAISVSCLREIHRRSWTGNVAGLIATLDAAVDVAGLRALAVHDFPQALSNGESSSYGRLRQSEQ